MHIDHNLGAKDSFHDDEMWWWGYRWHDGWLRRLWFDKWEYGKVLELVWSIESELWMSYCFWAECTGHVQVLYIKIALYLRILLCVADSQIHCRADQNSQRTEPMNRKFTSPDTTLGNHDRRHISSGRMYFEAQVHFHGLDLTNARC